MFVDGSYGRGCTYSRPNLDSEIEVITGPEAQEVHQAYVEFLEKNMKLKNLLYHQDAIPVLYTSDTTLNIPLKAGDVLLKRSFRYPDEVSLVVVEDSEYDKLLKNIPQKEQFFEWATESYKDIQVSIPGRQIIVNDFWSQFHNRPSGCTFYIGAYKTDCYLLSGVKNPKTTAKKVQDYNNYLYEMIKNLYEKYYGSLKQEPKMEGWTYDPDTRA